MKVKRHLSTQEHRGLRVKIVKVISPVYYGEENMINKMIIFITLCTAILITQCSPRIEASGISAGQDARLHDRLGDNYFQCGKKKDALLEWEKAIRLDGGNPSPYLKLGHLYFQSGYSEKSVFYLKKAVELSPANAYAHFNLALALFSCGNQALAEKEFQKAIIYSPRLTQNLGNVSPATGDRYTATPGPAELAHFFLACIDTNKGDCRRAVFELRHTFYSPSHLSVKADNIKPLIEGYIRGNAPVPLESHEWAIMVSKGGELAASQALAEKWRAFNDDDERIIYEESLEKNAGSWPSRIEALNYLSASSARKGDYKEAEKRLSEALKMCPDNPFLLFNAGVLYWKSGALEEAERALRMSEKGFTADSWWGTFNLTLGRSHFYRGLMEKSRKNDREAGKHLRASLSLDPLTGYEACLPLAELEWARHERTSSLIYLLEFLRASLVTSNPLDIAIAGEGFFEVHGDRGETLYTRMGAFTLSASGDIVTREGYRAGITVPEGISDLKWTAEANLTGTDRKGAKISLGRLKVLSPAGYEKLKMVEPGYFISDSAASPPILSPLLPGYMNIPTSLTDRGESQAWQFLTKCCAGDEGTKSLFLKALSDSGSENSGGPRLAETKNDFPGFRSYCAAKSLLYRGHLREALEAFHASLAEGKDNEFIQCQCEAVAAYLEKGRPSQETIQETLKMLEELRQPSPQADLYRGWIQERAGNNAAALRHYSRFLEKEKEATQRVPEFPLSLYARLHRIAGSSNFSTLEALMPHRPGMIAQGFSLCSTVLPAKKWSTVRPVCEMSSEEKELFAHLRRGLLLEESGELGEAIKEYKNWVHIRGLLNPLLSSFYSEDLVRAYFKAGMLDEARNELDLMIYDHRFFNLSLANLFRMLGKAYDEKGEKGKAYECYSSMEEIQKELKRLSPR
jgi:tetratricopeptide (TPR) repeat protein